LDISQLVGNDCVNDELSITTSLGNGITVFTISEPPTYTTTAATYYPVWENSVTGCP